MRKLGIRVITINEEKCNDETKSSDCDNDLPGEGRREGKDAQEKNKRNQEKLQSLGSQIPVCTHRNVNFSINPGANGKAFKYLVYDGYRPLNLA